ncbi:MAG: hypothetical protein EOO59_18925, partial [Hymenobacter sp.]
MKCLCYLVGLVLLSGPSYAQKPVVYSAPVYKANLAQLTAKRTELAARYRQAATPAAQAACLAKARELWLNAL